ncbi:hypothetical protein ACSV4D_01785 [Flavobacterium sp. ARAG 55.4]|uniref:hypothetical protein n=1 Tax=Flavobacterium sp. ARAG 55.4 TaxID=3451357 RepID=UPI003F46AC98
MDELVTLTEEDLQTRSSYLCKIASEKKFSFGWEDMESHFELFIEEETGLRIFDEIVLVSGVPTLERTHRFYDIIENELDKY